jgi:exopolyphosphatase/pppGpp-phosphohydrolase
MKLKLLFIFCFLFLNNITFSQDLYGGIEIGSQGIKSSIIKIKNTQLESYESKEFWTTNIGLAKNLGKNGFLEEDKIDEAVKIVVADFEKMQNEFKINIGNIYIVASSGVKVATNIETLIDKIRDITMKNVNVVSAETESKLLLRGCVPQKNFMNSLILDFGGNNIKGGFVLENKNKNIAFAPLSLNFGTISFAEILNQKSGNKLKIEPYIEEIFNYIPTLDKQFIEMLNQNDLCKTKENIYLTGGAPWAFCMMDIEVINDDYNQFTFLDLQNYNATLKNNFESYEKLSETNPNIAKVLKTYNRRQLLAANTLLMSALENIGNLETKKIYYTKYGQIGWLISYVLDAASGVKIPY